MYRSSHFHRIWHNDPLLTPEWVLVSGRSQDLPKSLTSLHSWNVWDMVLLRKEKQKTKIFLMMTDVKWILSTAQTGSHSCRNPLKITYLLYVILQNVLCMLARSHLLLGRGAKPGRIHSSVLLKRQGAPLWNSLRQETIKTGRIQKGTGQIPNPRGASGKAGPQLNTGCHQAHDDELCLHVTGAPTAAATLGPRGDSSLEQLWEAPAFFLPPLVTSQWKSVAGCPPTPPPRTPSLPVNSRTDPPTSEYTCPLPPKWAAPTLPTSPGCPPGWAAWGGWELLASAHLSERFHFCWCLLRVQWRGR